MFSKYFLLFFCITFQHMQGSGADPHLHVACSIF